MAANDRKRSKVPSRSQMRSIVRAHRPNEVEAQRLAERIVPARVDDGAIFYSTARRVIATDARRQLTETGGFDPLVAAVRMREYGRLGGRAAREVAMIACQALDAFDRECRQAAEAECKAVLDAARSAYR